MPRETNVAILVADQYEEMELWYPYHRLREAGCRPLLVGAEKKTYTGKKGAYPAAAERAARDMELTGLHAVVVPGGYAPDLMRREPAMVELVARAHAAGLPIAAICHAGWLLVSAGIVAGKRVTSFPSIRDDMVNAGAEWEDAEVVVDGNLITSRRPDDLPAFVTALLQQLL